MSKRRIYPHVTFGATHTLSNALRISVVSFCAAISVSGRWMVKTGVSEPRLKTVKSKQERANRAQTDAFMDALGAGPTVSMLESGPTAGNVSAVVATGRVF
eukprot:COSAG02_NODE_3479_length_6673_cov_3.496197_6_plen_101_part_00